MTLDGGPFQNPTFASEQNALSFISAILAFSRHSIVWELPDAPYEHKTWYGWTPLEYVEDPKPQASRLMFLGTL